MKSWWSEYLLRGASQSTLGLIGGVHPKKSIQHNEEVIESK